MNNTTKSASALIAAVALSLAPTTLKADDDHEGGAERPYHAEVEIDYADWGLAEREWAWEAAAWVGNQTDKFWVYTEGEWENGEFEHAEVQLLWNRTINDVGDLKVGWRHDFQSIPTNHLVVALTDLDLFTFETQIESFVSHRGDVSFRIDVERDLALTDDLTLTPYLETDYYVNDIPELEVGPGLSSLETGVQIGYELLPGVAPYIDLNYSTLMGRTKTLAEEEDEDPNAVVIRLGLELELD